MLGRYAEGALVPGRLDGDDGADGADGEGYDGTKQLDDEASQVRAGILRAAEAVERVEDRLAKERDQDAGADDLYDLVERLGAADEQVLTCEEDEEGGKGDERDEPQDGAHMTDCRGEPGGCTRDGGGDEPEQVGEGIVEVGELGGGRFADGGGLAADGGHARGGLARSGSLADCRVRLACGGGLLVGVLGMVEVVAHASPWLVWLTTVITSLLYRFLA